MAKNLLFLLFCFIVLAAGGQSLPGSGNSVVLNGSTQYFNCGTADRGITSNVTVEAWIKTTNFQGQFAVCKYSDGNGSDSGIEFGTLQGKAGIWGRVKVGTYFASGLSTTIVSDGRWHHIAGQVDGNTWRIYVDGVLENSATFSYSGGDLRTPAALYIGVYTYLNSFYFQGDLDEVRMWRTVRTTAEIQQNMCRKFATAPTDLVAYYRFDQSNGTTAIDAGSQPTNGIPTSTIASAPWHLSGAPLGDASNSLYTSTVFPVSARVGAATLGGDSAIITGIGSAARGVQVYAVNSPPSIAAGAGASSSYFGVFTAAGAGSPAYTLRLRPASNVSCFSAQQRPSNDQTWNSLMAASTTATSQVYGPLTYRGEYIMLGGSTIPRITLAGDTVVCAGQTTQLTAAATGATAYLWTTGATTATASGLAPGTYSVTASFAGGCTRTRTVTVTVHPASTATAGAPVAFCSGGMGQLGAAPIAGLVYSWGPATGLSSTTSANPIVTLINPTSVAVTTTYTLTVTSAQGCSNTSTVAVTVYPQPAVVPGANLTLCAGETGQLGAAPVAGCTYSWSPATGLSNATSANPTVALPNPAAAPATTTYTLTVISASGCSGTGTVDVTVNPLPVAVPGAAVATCSGVPVQLGAAPVTGLTYSWSPATGLSSATVANPIVILFNPTGAATAQTYTLTTTNSATGCMHTGTVAVTVNAELAAGIIGSDQTVCTGTLPAAFTNTAAASGGTGSYNYQWESSPDKLTWTPIGGATGATYTPGPATLPLYFRRRVTSGACGTDFSNTVQLQLQPLLVAGVALPPLAAQCPGATLIFVPIPTNAGLAPTYRWFVNGALVATSPTYTSSTLVQGDQVRVELTPTAGFCATGPAVATVAVSVLAGALPTVAMSAKTALPICAGQPVSFSLDQATNAGAAPRYQWQLDGQNVPGATAPTFTATGLRDGQLVTLVLTATTAGCGDQSATSAGVSVQVNPLADVDAGPDQEIMLGESVTLSGTANGTYPVTWAPLTGLTFPTNNPLQPLAAPAITTIYTLAGGSGPCRDASSVQVKVTPRLRIPSAFTPNGDGLDDTWQIDHLGEYANNHVIIFNRWGAKLFDTADYGQGNEWDGTISGKPAPLSTYYYIITLANGKVYTGPLTIIY